MRGRVLLLGALLALLLAPPAADAFRGGGDCSDLPIYPSDRRTGSEEPTSNRLTFATFDARWIASMSPVNATAKGTKPDKAVADQIRQEDRLRYQAFGKILAEIEADVVDVSGTNGCGAVRQMLSAEVQLLPAHASKVRQYLHERPADKGVAMAHHGLMLTLDPSANLTRVDNARLAYPLPSTRCPRDPRDDAPDTTGSTEECEQSKDSCDASDDADGEVCAAGGDPHGSCAHTDGVRTTGPPKDHYITRVPVGRKNVTLVVVHFDELQWTCARREAAASALMSQAYKIQTGDGSDNRTMIDDIAVIARLPHDPLAPGMPHGSDAEAVVEALMSSDVGELVEAGGDAFNASSPRNRTSAVFLSRGLVNWTTSIVTREVRTEHSVEVGHGHPLVVSVTFKTHCAFSGDVDTWEEFFTPRVIFDICFESACFCVWFLGLYRLFMGKDEGPHWMKNFFRWQMDIPTLEEYLAEERRLDALEEKEELEAEAREKAEKAAKAKGSAKRRGKNTSGAGDSS